VNRLPWSGPSECGIAHALAARQAPVQTVAIVGALQFHGASTHRLSQLVPKQWEQLLQWCDRRQLTLLLPNICEAGLPPLVRSNISDKTRRYGIRFERLKASLFEIAAAFQNENLDFVLLKGLSHSPAMTPDALHRAQGDIDLWLRGPSVYRAEAILRGLGYVSVTGSKSRHLGPMARPSNWRWRGDLFDSDMPISVELHYELWSASAEFVEAPRLDEFWERRTVREFDGHKIHVLCDQDLLGFSALHLLLHLLHGDLPLQRAWEIARFLDIHAGDEQFWETWSKTHCFELRQLETPMYCLVHQWFGCRLPECVRAEIQGLSQQVKAWLAESCLAPLSSEWKPNKREVWLHLALIKNRKDKVKLLVRRLFPLSLPAISQPVTFRTWPEILVRYIRFLASRFARHLVTLGPTILDALRSGVLGRL
jgi:hypothetical protein